MYFSIKKLLLHENFSFNNLDQRTAIEMDISGRNFGKEICIRIWPWKCVGTVKVESNVYFLSIFFFQSADIARNCVFFFVFVFIIFIIIVLLLACSDFFHSENLMQVSKFFLKIKNFSKFCFLYFYKIKYGRTCCKISTTILLICM